MTVSRGERQNRIARAAWLLMLKEGGRWETPELRDRLNAEHSVHCHMHRMASTGYAARFEPEGGGKRGLTYGVTADCKVPTGVTLSDILKAMEGS